MKSTEVYISADRSKLDIGFIHEYLSNEAYWAKGRSLEDVKKSIENSLCFGIYDRNSEKQLGFARVATDYVVFAWIMDLFIDKKHRGLGYSKLLMDAMINHTELKNVNGFGLRTNDAHGLYSQFGFGQIPNPDTWMFKKNTA